MIYGFDTEDDDAATAALVVYAIYRSRDRARFKASLDMWAQIERFVKDAAKRSRRIPQFVEALKPRLCCGTINPRWMSVGMSGDAPLVLVHNEDGSLRHMIDFGSDIELGKREFLTRVLERADQKSVIRRLYEETAWVVLLVRDRLERERPIEQKLDLIDEEEHA